LIISSATVAFGGEREGADHVPGEALAVLGKSKA
jgi:hypothetical protein